MKVKNVIGGLWVKKNKIFNSRLADELDFIKFVLMIIIVLYHSMIFFTGNWFNQSPVVPSNFYSIFSKWLNTFHIYAFTIISGYIFAYIKYERGGV